MLDAAVTPQLPIVLAPPSWCYYLLVAPSWLRRDIAAPSGQPPSDVVAVARPPHLVVVAACLPDAAAPSGRCQSTKTINRLMLSHQGPSAGATMTRASVDVADNSSRPRMTSDVDDLVRG